MQDKLHKNTNQRDKNRVNNVQNDAYDFVFSSFATKNSAQQHNKFVRNPRQKADQNAQAKIEKLIFAVHYLNNRDTKLLPP